MPNSSSATPSTSTQSDLQRRRTRIVLVDDHEIVRFCTTRLIEAEPDLDVCGEAADAPSAWELIQSVEPDVAIIDLSLKQGSGLDLVRKVRHACPSILMIVCSMHDETLYAPRVLRAGARGYVGKQQSAELLVAAIRQVLAGRLFLSQRMTERLLERATGLAMDEEPTQLQSLSDRELQVFELIGEGLTMREVGSRLSISPKTVEFHRERIRDKLQVPSNTELTRQAMSWVVEQSLSGSPPPSLES
jgi:DNA-binding NarL/FixJ family response regulator